jgi:hypothetical protein
MQDKVIDIWGSKAPCASLSDPHLQTFIEQQASEPLYFSHAWLGLVMKIYGYSIIPLVSTNAIGQITGYLPLSFIQSPITGRRLVSLPFADNCPLLASDDASATSLLDQAIYLAQEKRVKYLELRTGSNEMLTARSDFVEENLYVRWVLPLTSGSSAIWSGLRKTVQQTIRKSKKSGVQVRTAQKREEMAQYYRLHLLTRSKKHGMPAQPLSFFTGLWDAFAESGTLKLLLAEYQGTVVAGIILLASGTTVRYAYSASDQHYLHLAANNLLLWEGIIWAYSQGYTTLDLGRTACDNQGLMFYKRGWGAAMEPLPYYYFPHKMGLAATSESSLKFRLFTTCWKRLPTSIAGPLGGYLYSHLG